MSENVAATLKAVALGLVLGGFFAVVTAALERQAFIPVSAVVAIVTVIGMLLVASVLAFFRSRRRVAKSMLIAGVVLFTSYYTALTMMGR